MHITDQPGRWLAVLVFAPLLLWRGRQNHDRVVVGFACLLFTYDAWWLMFRAAKCAQF